jgi:hypothetical protein
MRKYAKPISILLILIFTFLIGEEYSQSKVSDSSPDKIFQLDSFSAVEKVKQSSPIVLLFPFSEAFKIIISSRVTIEKFSHLSHDYFEHLRTLRSRGPPEYLVAVV